MKGRRSTISATLVPRFPAPGEGRAGGASLAGAM